MKQLIILLLLIIAFIIGYGQYKQYKRYNSPNIDYKTDKKLDLEYYNQEQVLNYNEAIENLNSYVMLQWTANSIDVRTPEDDDEETKQAVEKYAKKLAILKYYEAKLEKSSILKEKGLSNKEIQFLEETGTDLKTYNKTLATNKIKSMFNADKKIIYGQKSALIYEIQKKLISNGFEITLDGFYKTETLNAIKNFEEKNNLFVDGVLDALTLDALFK
ncbi:peptidoglycan-binding domain-containing protein [Polaribacter sp. Hel1_85]|uniref:peptidoglycan-binding domain-containing protein n=1 Tax=Polaribacter sp. Hel1_85 TaxID=1250005 RepID=UPI00052BCB57|nr:peptidoglycan-binding domain-containing protein [Polaribacter sp. Hel1_85]KGL63845.1 peptidoglycan-binding protein domain protein 1 protein [Polaribacter sp. Hel1_85]